jgi:hypothetical protein
MSWHVGGKSAVCLTSPSPRFACPTGRCGYNRAGFAPISKNVGGERIAVLSTSWQTAALMAPQDRDYRAFIMELHRRLAQADSKVELIGGLRPTVYVAALVLLALAATAMTGLLVRAVVTGELAGLLFLAGFAALFSWQIGGFVRRNRPCRYTFEDLPKGLLP